MTTELVPIKQDAILHAREGATYKDIAEKLGISRTELFNIRAADPTFKQLLEDAMYDGSSIVLDEIRSVPYEELCPQRARVKIDALCRYLELRWPQRYGKQVNVNLKVLDMRSALDKARERVKRIQPQVIDMYPDSNGMYTDKQSVDAVNLAVSSIDELF